jgi:hypothetical protein
VGRLWQSLPCCIYVIANYSFATVEKYNDSLQFTSYNSLHTKNDAYSPKRRFFLKFFLEKVFKVVIFAIFYNYNGLGMGGLNKIKTFVKK